MTKSRGKKVSHEFAFRARFPDIPGEERKGGGALGDKNTAPCCWAKKLGNNRFRVSEKKTSIFECKFLQACSFGKGAEREKKFLFLLRENGKHKPGEKRGEIVKKAVFSAFSYPLLLLISAKGGGPWLGDFYRRPSIILPQSFAVSLGFAKSAK